MSIFEYCEERQDRGVGLALLNADDDVVTPYVDPSDYPTLTVDTQGRSTSPEYQGWWICPHGGVLEIDPHYFSA